MPVDAESGVRYLEPIVYQGEPGSWTAPELERERFDSPVRAPKPPPPGTTARELESLTGELERTIFVDGALHAAIRNAHAADDLRTTRLVEHVILKASDGSLRNPGGYLWKQLRDIAQRPDADST